MIKLTGIENQEVRVNPLHLRFIFGDDFGSKITMSETDFLYVMETPQAICDLISAWLKETV